MSVNIALNQPIHSYSSQYGYVYTADKINNGNYTLDPPYIWVSGEDQVSNQWIIIDLGEVRTINRVVVYSAYYEFIPEMAVKDFRVGISITGTSPTDFFTVVDDTLPLPSSSNPPPVISTNLFQVPARYVKLYLDNNHGDLNYLLAGEIEVYSDQSIEGSTVLNSDAYITREELTSDAHVLRDEIFSDAYIIRETLNSDAYIVQPASTITSDTYIIRDTLNSDAYIIQPSSTITSDTQIQKEFLSVLLSESSITIPSESTIISNAQIQKEFLEEITSSASILGDNEKLIISSALISKTFFPTIQSDTQILIYPSAETITSIAQIQKDLLVSDAYIIQPISLILSTADIVNVNYAPTITSDTRVIGSGSISQRGVLILGGGTSFTSTRNVYISSQQYSSSQTIVPDIISSSIMDLMSVNTPLAYNNYDWAYDWVTRQWNGCITKFEARASDNVYELNGEPWAQIYNGQLISRASVKRYHQWRLHLWASGSQDFELHQFSIKCFSNYASSRLYAGLI